MIMGSVDSPIILRIHSLLDECDFKQAHDILLDSTNEDVIKENAWDLIPVVCSHLSDDALIKNSECINWCENILQQLAAIGNPKELLVGFLEQADHFKNDICFKVLLKPVQTVLQKLPGKRGRSLEWTLDTFTTYVQQLPLPPQYNLEGSEKILLDLDPKVCRICTVLSEYIPFFEPFVEEVSIKAINRKEVSYIDRIIHQRNVLAKVLLKVLNRPLIFLDLNNEVSKAKSNQFVCCEKIVYLLSQICGNCLTLYDLGPKVPRFWAVNHCNNDINNGINSEEAFSNKYLSESGQTDLSALSVANLAYLIFGENLCYDFLPCVYSHQYLLLKHIGFIIALLTQDVNCIIDKGLKLAGVILCYLQHPELTTEHLEMLEFKDFPNALVKVMVHCPVEEHRQAALKILLQYISKFEFKGCFNILLYLITSQKHPGFQGLIIGLYKDYLCKNLYSHDATNFIKKNLHKFLILATELPDKVETDILEHSDRIISALNFLRYLFLSDKKEINITGVWTYHETITESFLKPLRKGIDLSRAHYKLEVHRTEEEEKLIKRKKHTLNSTVSAYGQTLPNLPPNHQIKVLQAALLTFDLMESILVRVDEITNI